MYRFRDGSLEVFLAHPGGPYWNNRDDGHWSIPKGEQPVGEQLHQTALREFEEETGIEPRGPFMELGSTRQKSGKIVHAWAFEGDCPASYELHSNTFSIEWPPGSGSVRNFPEVDRAQFFSVPEARKKLNVSQLVLLERLITLLLESE
jgi:predicted NUDIX family NTP pyrophosphohydrolase